MSDGRFTPETARAAGRKGGKAAGRKRLSLDRVEAELGTLDSLEDAQRWLRTVALWVASGMLSGAGGNVCVRAVEVWVKANESRLSREIVGELRARLEELESGIKRQGVRLER